MADERYTRCDRCKREYRTISVSTCPHPKVNQYLGNHICVYCCKRCKHHIDVPWALKCGYIGGDNNE